MSRITQLAEMVALRRELDATKEALRMEIARLNTLAGEVIPRIEALEAKRGPGRPKNTKDE